MLMEYHTAMKKHEGEPYKMIWKDPVRNLGRKKPGTKKTKNRQRMYRI